MLTKSLLSADFHLRAYVHSWLDELAELTEFTPDLVDLEAKEWQNVFIYGNMMEEHLDCYLLEGKEAERQAIAYTQEEYTVEKRDLGKFSYPIAYQYRKSPLSLKRPLRIRGELHKVRPYYFTVLDNHMRNTVEFIRKRVNVVVPMRKANGAYEERLTIVEAWVYFGVGAFWNEQENWMFKPVATYDQPKERPWGPTYYYFSKRECQNQVSK